MGNVSSLIALTLASDDDVACLPAAVEEFASANALPMKAAYALDLVLEEIVTNIVKYGDGGGSTTVDVRVSRDGDTLKGAVRDNAAPFDPLARGPVDVNREIDDREVGGLGIHLVKSMTDSLTYAFENGQNVLSFSIDLQKEAS